MNFFDKHNEGMNRAELKKLQSTRLIQLVNRVYATVPSYKSKMDAIGLKPSDIKSTDDLHLLPFTTKSDLRDNYPYGLFAVPREDIVRIHASSGTTGKMTIVGYTKADLEIWKNTMARSLVMAGAKKGSVVHVAYGYGLFTGGIGAHAGAEHLGCTVVPASTGNTNRQITLLVDLGAEILCCTPSYAVYLAEEIEKSGIDKSTLKLRAGIFGAEPWTEEMRKIIEQKLNIRAYDIYGLSEILGPSVSCECEMQNGMHIQEDHFLPEIIDPENLKQLPIGEEGELVFTTLTKEGLPLIRYRTRDLTKLNDRPCECGRTSIKMSKVKGRSDDMLIIRGVNVFPSQIEAVLMNINDVSPHYQIFADRQNNQDKLTVKIEMLPSFLGDPTKAAEKTKRIEKSLLNVLGISVIVNLVAPNTIDRSESKAKRVIDNRNVW